MSRHPETSEIFFVRHAPVVKKSGHVPPADPPIQDLDYRVERVAAMSVSYTHLTLPTIVSV